MLEGRGAWERGGAGWRYPTAAPLPQSTRRLKAEPNELHLPPPPPSLPPFSHDAQPGDRDQAELLVTYGGDLAGFTYALTSCGPHAHAAHDNCKLLSKDLQVKVVVPVPGPLLLVPDLSLGEFSGEGRAPCGPDLLSGIHLHAMHAERKRRGHACVYLKSKHQVLGSALPCAASDAWQQQLLLLPQRFAALRCTPMRAEALSRLLSPMQHPAACMHVQTFLTKASRAT